MEAVACDLCGSSYQAAFRAVKDRFSGETFQLVHCASCGLVYLSPRPTGQELERYYPEGYEPYLVDTGYHQRRALQLQAGYLEKHAPQRGRLLDVGCAVGSFLATAQERGWIGKGIEPSSQAAQVARERGLEVVTGFVESADLPHKAFEAATLWDVLEHLPAPTRTLQSLNELLVPGGILVGSIPNLDSYDRRLFGDHWIGWDTPRHLVLFDQERLAQILRKTGFELLETACFLGGRGTFELSLEILWRGRYRPLKNLLTQLSWPYRQLAYRLERGPILAFAAQKSTKEHESE